MEQQRPTVPEVPPGIEHRGALGAWWKQGTRTAFLLGPDWRGLKATPANSFWLLIVPMALTVLMQRLYVTGGASFNWMAVGGGWLPVILYAWACWLIAPRAGEAHDEGQPPDAVTLFLLLVAQWPAMVLTFLLVYVPMVRSGSFTPEALGTVGWWVAWLAPLAWQAAAVLRLTWRAGMKARTPRLLGVLAVLAGLALTWFLQPAPWWYPDASASSDEAPPPRFRLTQDVMELQPSLLQAQLAALKPPRAGVINVYTIVFAPYGAQDVFWRESTMVAAVMRERFDGEGRTLQLVNNEATARELPWATPLNLQRAIARVAEVMDRERDVLLVHLTSHGARDGELSARLWPMDLDRVAPAALKGWLDQAGVRYRVVSVSACFSGSWIAPLAGDGTLVMTAADADHTSFGCGSRSELTYFGRAVFDEELRRTWSFEEAHAKARVVIERREHEAGKNDGFSNPQIAVGAAIRAHLALLQAQRAASAQ